MRRRSELRNTGANNPGGEAKLAGSSEFGKPHPQQQQPVGVQQPRLRAVQKTLPQAAEWPSPDIWLLAQIRGNCRPHSAITHIGHSGVNYDPHSHDAGGDCSNGLVSPARGCFLSRKVTPLAMSEPPPLRTAIIAERWPARCTNWRATRGRGAFAGSWLIWPGATR